MSYSEVCPQPVRRAVMKQGWYDLAYIHFRYSVEEVAKVLPAGLEVDVCDGSAWVGLIPFSMRGIGVPGLPAVPYLGSFAEINVRTYVRHNGVPGVWFCSLDINRLLPTIVARTTYTLPYCFGRASNKRVGDELHTRVERRWPRGDRAANTNIRLKIGEQIVAPSPLEIFLSARWGLYTTTRGGSLRYAPISHEPWKLHRAELVSLDDSLIEAAGFAKPTIANNGEPQVMFSPGLPVRVGLPRRV
ncbi:MAG: YqjF family protein [Actinomycetota bacterium]